MKVLSNDTNSQQYVEMRKMLFNPYGLHDDELDSIIKGAMGTPVEKADNRVTDQVRHRSHTAPSFANSGRTATYVLSRRTTDFVRRAMFSQKLISALHFPGYQTSIRNGKREQLLDSGRFSRSRFSSVEYPTRKGSRFTRLYKMAAVLRSVACTFVRRSSINFRSRIGRNYFEIVQVSGLTI